MTLVVRNPNPNKYDAVLADVPGAVMGQYAIGRMERPETKPTWSSIWEPKTVQTLVSLAPRAAERGYGYARTQDLNLIKPPLYLRPALLDDPRLTDALDDLKECQEEAAEQGFPKPTQTAVDNAERLLQAMFKLLPRRFEVYPMPSGAIAIQASKAPEIAISVLCDSDGAVHCLVSAPDHFRRARYSTADILPDGFLYDALKDLERFGG